MKNSKLIVMFVLVVLLGTVAIQNRGPVDTTFVMVTVTMPLILLLVLTAAVGFAIGLLVAMTGKGRPASGAPKA